MTLTKDTLVELIRDKVGFPAQRLKKSLKSSSKKSNFVSRKVRMSKFLDLASGALKRKDLVLDEILIPAKKSKFRHAGL